MNRINNCKAAFSQIDITPDYPVELIGGYREDSQARGILHRLYAQILLFEFGDERSCLIAIDSLGLTTKLSDELRSLIAQTLGIPVSRIMLNYSHTHSAPAPLSPLNGQKYFTQLCSGVVEAAQQALLLLQPCLIGWAVTESELAENRREGCSLVDRRFGAIQIVNEANSSPIALVIRVNAHANILMRDNNLSSDYFGMTRDKLSDEFGCPAMLLQGASGNLKPTGVDTLSGGTLQDVERISQLILQDARRLQFKPGAVERLKMYSKEIEFYSDVPSKEQALQIANEARNCFGIDGAGWLDECERLRLAGIENQVQSTEIQFFFLNEGCICGLPDEIFCEISLEASLSVESGLLFLNGYTNGCTGYLSHLEEWEKGGYETLYSYLMYYPFHGHVMPFQKDTAQRIVELVVTEWCHRRAE